MHVGAALPQTSKFPAVRVCAAHELRRLKDPRMIDHFKKALKDPYKRRAGACVRRAEGLIYPVRGIASAALLDLAVPFSEIRKLRGVIGE